MMFHDFKWHFPRGLIFYKVKKESTTSSTNKRTKTYYRDYLHIVIKLLCHLVKRNDFYYLNNTKC